MILLIIWNIYVDRLQLIIPLEQLGVLTNDYQTIQMPVVITFWKSTDLAAYAFMWNIVDKLHHPVYFPYASMI